MVGTGLILPTNCQALIGKAGADSAHLVCKKSWVSPSLPANHFDDTI
jgi:hypothetical protein